VLAGELDRIATLGVRMTCEQRVEDLVDVVMTASALLRHGPEHATVLLAGPSDWMARKEFAAVDDLRGMLAVPPGTDGAAYERVGYVGALREANTGSYEPGEQRPDPLTGR
jgi:hypothetical protein